MKFNKRRGIVLGVIVAIAAATSAYAYWTAGGTGTGSASVASGATPLTANQTSVLTAMYPGDSAQTLSGDFNNPNSGLIYVATVAASVASVTNAVGAPAGTGGSRGRKRVHLDPVILGGPLGARRRISDVAIAAWSDATAHDDRPA